jgi:uncharacterized protein (TIGR02117 family)
VKFKQNLLILLLLLLAVSACANRNLQLYLQQYDSYPHAVYVIDHGIHTAIVMQSMQVLPAIGLQDSIYRKYRYVEIGRGDAGFYQEKEEKLSTALAAIFLSTPAVLHLRGYNSPPYRRYPQSRTLEVRLSRIALQKLVDALADSFAMENGVAIEVGEGVDERSRFFKALGNYHLFYTCNNWTAEMIELADYPLNHRWAFFAGSVMKQIESVQRQLGLSCRDVGGYQCNGNAEAER